MSKPKRTATPAARQTRASIQQRLAERDRQVFELDQQGLTPGEIADILHLSPKLVSEARARLGLVTTRRRDPALEADREQLAALDDDQLRQRLATLSDAAGLMVRAMELGVDAGELARHALARGLPLAGADRIPAAASGWGSRETWTAFRKEIAGRGMRVAAAFRDAHAQPRALVVCDGCAAEGGCGFTPEPRAYLGNLARGQPGLCMRRSGEQRGDAQRRSEAEARAAIEEGEYWTYLGGYQGAHAEVQLRCPEGHIGDYPYTKALRGQRCRACCQRR